MYILFDIGGTKMRIAASKNHKTFSKPVVVLTPQNFSEAVELFVETALKLAGGQPITAAAGGLPGPLDGHKTMVVNAPNLHGWNNRPFVKIISKRIGAPVFIENDTAMAGLGEYARGAARKYNIAAYMTVSTGVGGCRVVDGSIDASSMGFEPGWQVIDATQSLGAGGFLEHYVSGTAVAKRFGKPAYNIHDAKVWDELAQWLAYGINNAIVFWSPDIIVLGGAMITKHPAIPLDAIRRHLKKIMIRFPKLPNIVLAELGDTGGLHGALYYLNRNKNHIH